MTDSPARTGHGQRIRVALVDDYEVVLQGLASMLRSYTDDFDIVELDLHVPVAAPVDIALYDTFAQPQGDSETVTSLIDNPRVSRVVVYTWNFQEALTRTSLEHGVSGYLSKSLPAADLAAARRAVVRGETLMSPDTGRFPVVTGEWPRRGEGLTARE